MKLSYLKNQNCPGPYVLHSKHSQFKLWFYCPEQVEFHCPPNVFFTLQQSLKQKPNKPHTGLVGMLTRHSDPVLWASGWRPVSASRRSTDPTETASWASAAPRKLHTQPVAVVVITISPIDCIISVPMRKKSCILNTAWREPLFLRRVNAVRHVGCVLDLFSFANPLSCNAPD